MDPSQTVKASLKRALDPDPLQATYGAPGGARRAPFRGGILNPRVMGAVAGRAPLVAAKGTGSGRRGCRCGRRQLNLLKPSPTACGDAGCGYAASATTDYVRVLVCESVCVFVYAFADVRKACVTMRSHAPVHVCLRVCVRVCIRVCVCLGVRVCVSLCVRGCAAERDRLLFSGRP